MTLFLGFIRCGMSARHMNLRVERVALEMMQGSRPLGGRKCTGVERDGTGLLGPQSQRGRCEFVYFGLRGERYSQVKPLFKIKRVAHMNMPASPWLGNAFAPAE
jgi:hypothetical protein